MKLSLKYQLQADSVRSVSDQTEAVFFSSVTRLHCYVCLASACLLRVFVLMWTQLNLGEENCLCSVWGRKNAIRLELVFKENHSLARRTTTFCLVLQSRHMFAYASPGAASFVFACRCGPTFYIAKHASLRPASRVFLC